MRRDDDARARSPQTPLQRVLTVRYPSTALPQVMDRQVVLIDDIVDTGNTLVRSARELVARGARSVIAFATHGLLSQDAADRLARAEELEKVVFTNTVPTIVSSLPADHMLRRKASSKKMPSSPCPRPALESPRLPPPLPPSPSL